MSFPTEIDQAIIYRVPVGGGARVPICGIENVTINETVNTSDAPKRDCAKPGAVPYVFPKANSRQADITGSGTTNADDIAARRALLGIIANYEVDAISRDGTDAGVLLGTFECAAMMTSSNLNTAAGDNGGSEITLRVAGELAWTRAQ